MTPKDVRRAVYFQVDRFSAKFREMRREDREEGVDEFGYYYPYLNGYLDLGRGKVPSLRKVRVKDEGELECEMGYWREDLEDLVGVLLDKKEHMDDKVDAANDILKILPKVYVVRNNSGKKKRRKAGNSGNSVKIGMPSKKRRFVREIVVIE
jgi:hypothetical protein